MKCVESRHICVWRDLSHVIFANDATRVNETCRVCDLSHVIFTSLVTTHLRMKWVESHHICEWRDLSHVIFANVVTCVNETCRMRELRHVMFVDDVIRVTIRLHSSHGTLANHFICKYNVTQLTLHVQRWRDSSHDTRDSNHVTRKYDVTPLTSSANITWLNSHFICKDDVIRVTIRKWSESSHVIFANVVTRVNETCHVCDLSHVIFADVVSRVRSFLQMKWVESRHICKWRDSNHVIFANDAWVESRYICRWSEWSHIIFASDVIWVTSYLRRSCDTCEWDVSHVWFESRHICGWHDSIRVISANDMRLESPHICEWNDLSHNIFASDVIRFTLYVRMSWHVRVRRVTREIWVTSYLRMTWHVWHGSYHICKCVKSQVRMSDITRTWMSRVTSERATAHIRTRGDEVWCILVRVVTCTNESSHKCKGGMSHMWISRVTYDRVTAHVRTRGFIRVETWGHVYEWVMSHVAIGHIARTKGVMSHTATWLLSYVRYDLSHMNESWHTYEPKVWCILVRVVARTNGPCHAYEWVISHVRKESSRAHEQE